MNRDIIDENFDDVLLLDNYDYDSALVGVTTDDRAIYDYDLMVEYLMETEGFKDELDAIEWLEYNTIRAIGYFGDRAPIIMHSLKDFE